jgi:hypothetical protein
MKTTASNNALKNGSENGNFKSVKERIYALIYLKSRTLDDIVLLGIKRQTASEMLSELEEEGLVRSTGDYLSFYSLITDPLEQKLHAQARQHTFYLNWVKLGKEKGYFTKYFLKEYH